jgi:SlyX protein
MSTEAIERLEMKIAFLERANNELSDVVYRQQREIQGLAAKMAALSDRVSSMPAADEARTPEDERPPHY